MYGRFIARDAAVVALASLFWWWLADRSAGNDAFADLSGFLAGTLAGISAFLLHEWGHVLGAVLGRSTVQVNENLRSPFIFRFESQPNSLRQFVVMSLGGFVMTALLVAAAYLYLPDGLLATRVARGAVLFLAALGITLELPLFLFAVASGTVPEAAAVKVRHRRPAAAT